MGHVWRLKHENQGRLTRKRNDKDMWRIALLARLLRWDNNQSSRKGKMGRTLFLKATAVPCATRQNQTNEISSKPALSKHYPELATRQNCLLTGLLFFSFKNHTSSNSTHTNWALAFITDPPVELLKWLVESKCQFTSQGHHLTDRARN